MTPAQANTNTASLGTAKCDTNRRASALPHTLNTAPKDTPVVAIVAPRSKSTYESPAARLERDLNRTRAAASPPSHDESEYAQSEHTRNAAQTQPHGLPR